MTKKQKSADYETIRRHMTKKETEKCWHTSPFLKQAIHTIFFDQKENNLFTH